MKFPSEPRKGYPLMAWCRDLLRYLRSSRITSVVGGKLKESPQGTTIIIDQPPRKPKETSHPWKVSNAGDDTISVGYGSVFSYQESSLTLREFKHFAGFAEESYSPITVTGTGSIYGRISSLAATSPDVNFSGADSNGDSFDVRLNRVFPDSSDDFLFSFNTTPPVSSSYFYFELAKVELVEGVAVITRQVIEDNITLSSWIEAV